jgi:peptidoglycan/LPS O-acetylase OafA/YrhL/lysophospholipase L1-like esterase
MIEPAPTRRLTYQPALDGLRAVAVLGVIAYHAGIESFRGGFLGVSTFFTLSGFLITSLLIREKAATGRVALGNFWARRLRRLLPAAVVTITATVLLAAAIGDDAQLARLRADGLASLFHFSNWRFIAEGDSYGALFESPSFFRHFWSLAVEEQYYLLVPPLLAGGLAVTGRLAPRAASRAFGGILVAMSILGLAWPAILDARGATTDRLYFGTDTRVGEITVGALLAWWFVRRDQRLAESRRAITAATIGTVAAAGVMALMWHSAHPSDTYLYTGGLAAHAALTLVVIVAAVAPTGPVRALLSWEPLRFMGELSYVAYLTHWPILLWLQSKTTLGPGSRFGLGLVVTTGVSLLVQRLVERPFRRVKTGSAVRWVTMAVPASLAVAVLIVAVTTWRTPASPPIDFAAAQTTLDELIDAPEPDPPAAPSHDGPSAPEPTTLAAFGDSTALMTGLGIVQWAQDHPGEIDIVRGNAKLGCGLIPGGVRKVEGRTVHVPDECDGWLDDWLDALGDAEVDVAVVQLGAWEITDHRTPGTVPFRSILDPSYAAEQQDWLDRMVAALHTRAGVVALVAHPDVGEARLRTVPSGASYPEYDPVRAQTWRDMLRETAATDPSIVVVELAEFIDAHPDDLRLRPDGVHFSQETGAEVAEWLVPEILDLVGEVDSAGDPSTPTTVPPTSTSPPPPAQPVTPQRILLAGDSLMLDSSFAIQAVFDTAEPAIVSEFSGQPSRARTDLQRGDWIERVDAFDPDLVIEYFGYWEFAAAGLSVPPIGADGFAEVYRREVLDPWFDDLEALGTEVLVLGAAPTGNPTVDPNIELALDIAAAVASERPSVTFLPTAEVLAPDGYTQLLPDPRTGEMERVRRLDGLHLCPDGGEQVADLITDHLAATYDIRFDPDPMSTGWRVGPWREALPVDLAEECPPVAP